MENTAIPLLPMNTTSNSTLGQSNPFLNHAIGASPKLMDVAETFDRELHNGKSGESLVASYLSAATRLHEAGDGAGNEPQNFNSKVSESLKEIAEAYNSKGRKTVLTCVGMTISGFVGGAVGLFKYSQPVVGIIGMGGGLCSALVAEKLPEEDFNSAGRLRKIDKALFSEIHV